MGCAVGPQGKFIVSASGDKTLRVWECGHGKERFTLHSHSAGAWCAVSPPDDFIVSVCYDQRLKLLVSFHSPTVDLRNQTR